MDDEVAKFEETILYFADAYNLHGPGSSRGSAAGPLASGQMFLSALSSSVGTPSLTPDASSSSSRASSIIASQTRRPSFISRLSERLVRISLEDETVEEDDNVIDANGLEAWQVEAASVDRSVRILPGVKKMIDSLPEGQYAVATSGAKTYGEFTPLNKLFSFN